MRAFSQIQSLFPDMSRFASSQQNQTSTRGKDNSERKLTEEFFRSMEGVDQSKGAWERKCFDQEMNLLSD